MLKPQNQTTIRSQKIIDDFCSTISRIKMPENCDEAINVIENCKGKIVTTGMGKAGIAMRKFSATLCSLGVSSVFLHPGEASHGDLGVIDEKDLLFVASTSGKTREIIEVIDLSRAINSLPVIGLTSHPDSFIRKKANIVLDMGDFEEVGFLQMIPTASIVIMQIITDTIALIVSENKGFSKSDFGKLHHSGYLGELARM